MMLTVLIRRPAVSFRGCVTRAFYTYSGSGRPRLPSRTVRACWSVRLASWSGGVALKNARRSRFSSLLISSGLFSYLRNIPTAVLDRPFADPNPPNQNVVFLRKKEGFLLRAAMTLRWLWLALRRCLRFLLTFAPFLLAYPLLYAYGFDATRRLYLRCLLFAVECSGPTVMKLAQWASTRRDLFSADFCHTFARLQRSVKPHSWYFTKQRLRRAFGKNWRKILVKFDNNRNPIGSGCIAQVYKAYMPADLVADESLLEEINESLEPDPYDIDFDEGIDVLGFAKLFGTNDSDLDDAQEECRGNWGERQENEMRKQEAEAKDNVEEHSSIISSLSSEPGDNLEGLVPVAVKVLHPGIYRSVVMDLNILRGLSHIVEFTIPSLRWISLNECIEEFSQLMMNQLDFTVEANNLERFWANFEQNPNVRVPRPVRPYVKSHVLVEKFEEGEPISKFIHAHEDQPKGLHETLASYGVDAILQMVFVDNFVHGDLHPGNILVQNADVFVSEENNQLVLVDICDTVVVNVRPVECPTRLVILDCGIASSLSEHDLDNLRAVFTAVVLGEGEKVANLFLEKAHECTDLEGYRTEMANIVDTAHEQSVRLGKMQVAELLRDFFSCLIRHRVKLDSNYASVMLAIMVLEGLGRSLDPEMDIMECAKPILLGRSNGHGKGQ
ncbi:PREDICTED: uncharacterized aarF domain-containing protein kinase 2-like [Priapulus caudatus]|uniref:Uncharacterized aarF domain-containing protein kinase 2-like n=1 Tax=Priapulus caudatus TaxID=37621 RepID=A0ABM1ECC7_PRICU|nr:PREDICTED: uncharacterized aarF domain-containing protein kinase 2-like [Priapulus caudatus]